MSDSDRLTRAPSWPWIGTCWRLCATPAMAVVWLITLGSVLMSANWLESRRGREWVHWYVYDSLWFRGLLGLIVLGAIVALFRRGPRRWRDGGQVFAHGGLLVLLLGAGWSQYDGAVGELILGERQAAEQLTNRTRTQIAIERASDTGRRSSQFAFTPGVGDWPAGKQLEFPEADGISLRIIQFVRYAQPHVDWIVAEHDAEAAALRVMVADPAVARPLEEWLTASAYGGELHVGTARLVFWPLYLETMVADFLDPPTDLGTAGVLSVHYQGRLYRFRVDDVRGQTVPLGDSGASVEFVDYYPDAKPQPDGRKFISRSNQPKNPVLELRVHLPNEPEPLRQLAFAKSPLLNLDGVLGRACPVRFWFHHGGLLQQAGVVFAQTPAGKLFARRVLDGKLADPVELQANMAVPIEGQSTVTVIRHLPHARRDVTFTSSAANASEIDKSEAAVQVAASVDGTQRTMWLSRGQDEFAYQVLATSMGLASVSCGYQQLDLGCQIELAELRSADVVADAKPSWEACILNVRKSPGEPPVPHTVALNHPLRLGAYRLCLTGFQEPSQGHAAAIFVVSRDPGRAVKYWGCALILCGLVWMACVRRSSIDQTTRSSDT